VYFEYFVVSALSLISGSGMLFRTCTTSDRSVKFASHRLTMLSVINPQTKHSKGSMPEQTNSSASPVSRRQFIKSSSLVAASAAAAVSFPYVTRAQAKQPINAVIIGVGGRGGGAGGNFLEAA